MLKQAKLSPEEAQLLSENCYHCGLDVTTGSLFSATIQEQERLFCCAGCQAVASLIQQGGLGNFYRYRSSLNQRPEANKTDYSVYEDASVQASFVRKYNNKETTAHLLLDGITCAACVWLIEKYLLSIEGVNSVRVNAANHQCSVSFDDSVQLSFLMEQLSQIGYCPHPFTQVERQHQQQQQQRQLLFRLGLAGFGMMLVGMIAISLYAGAIQGIDSNWVQLFRWVSLVVATPVVLFSAQPFWSAAWRNLKQYHLTMDVPVTIAIFLAYFASSWATISQTGEVYFDSISMFTFFLLLGRYFEMRLRYKNQQAAGFEMQLLPMTVFKVLDDEQQKVTALVDIVVGDTLRISSGETIPCDGLVIDGESAIDESMLTGEAEPQIKKMGDALVAGTVNTDNTLIMTVTAIGDKTRLSTISQLVDQAEYEKPKLQTIADKVASVFVAAVLIVASAVYFVWHHIDPSHALWVTLSVLVVTCPCALSLATPTALTAAIAKMRNQGLLVLRGHVVESLNHIDTVIFDKTGTLTIGRPKIETLDILDKKFSAIDILQIAAALEAGSNHPIAHAFLSHPDIQDLQPIKTVNKKFITGAGVSGEINGALYKLGKADFVGLGVTTSKSIHRTKKEGLLLSKNAKPIAQIILQDEIRTSAQSAINSLQKNNIRCEILSGDTDLSVKALANKLGITYQSEQTPEDKFRYIQKLQQSQRLENKLMMVGDGINDVPVLVGADVSVAMDTATDFARTRADSVLLNNNLQTLPIIINIAHKAKRIIKQNIMWAIGYNLLALPLAACGLIPPYLAAAGMSASSLIVVMNALRLYK